MSAAAAPDKTLPPKSAATFTSFINKNTSGKKFAPKAARRRPGAAPPPTPTQEPAAAAASPFAVAEPAPAPASTRPEPQAQPAADALDTDRPAKRRRTLPPATTPSHHQPAPPITVPAQAHDTATQHGGQEGATQLNEADADAGQQSCKTTLPWVAVNHPLEGKQAEAANAPAKKTRQPPRARGTKKSVVTAEAEGAEDEEGEEEEEAGGGEPGGQSTQKRLAARARNKGRLEEAGVEADSEANAPAKKPRKPRKDKGKKKTTGDPEPDAEEGAEQATDTIEETAITTIRKPRKPRQPKRTKQSTVEGENAGQDSQQPTQSKRRGRPPREDTPPDAEHQTIDPDATFMDSLASRNIRVGKLSTLERRMRDINWEEVRQRQREEDRRIIHTKETQAAVDKLLNAAGDEMEAANAEQGPRMRVVGDRIELIHDSGTIDREAEADMQIATMEVHEEADLTTRITTRSFMKNGKRFPNDFLLPGQGHRWSQEQTDRFYQGLRMYGTDFQMISMMFPNLSRRIIKTKFNREERENPDKVARCLLGELEMASGWGEFLQASELQDDHFADADEIKRQMDEVEVRMRIEIEAAKAETAERKRQLKEAGLLPEGEEGADGENGKGKKKRRERGKQVTFQEEEGVEILGGLDDDPNWGL